MTNTFEGSIVLERLAEFGLVDAFYDAIDSDNLPKAVSLMRKAQVDEDTIRTVIKIIQDLS